MRLKGTGKIIYDPHRPGLKSKTDWWCVANTDSEICRYYRWWVWRRYMIKLEKPAWGAHISIIRGEVPQEQFRDGWKKHHGEIIEFEYSPIVRYSGDTTGDRPNWFWFVDVWCPKMNDIRKELGLKWRDDNGEPFKFHITIGRTYY